MPYHWDVELFRAINIGWHEAWLDPFFCALSWLGLGASLTTLVFLGLIVPAGRKLFWPLIVSLVGGGILGADGLKSLLPRDRPSLLPWAHPQEAIYYHSFPSGHSAASFSLAVMLVLHTRGTKSAWVGWVALVGASLIGISRIYRGVHWPSDVLAGALCGTAFACAVYLAFGGKSAIAEGPAS
jgi:undecaprenyl-diphosphatase